MATLTATRHSTAIQTLLDGFRIPDLGPGCPNLAAKEQLNRLTPENAFPQVKDRDMARLCIAGLWLLHDFLEESHEISQTIKNPSGNYWHGIMHRREPDAWNAKYWFKQVGRHPALKRISDSYRVVYDPLDFIERAEACRDTGNDDERELKMIQRREWDMLFEYCHERAVQG